MGIPTTGSLRVWVHPGTLLMAVAARTWWLKLRLGDHSRNRGCWRMPR